MKKSIIKKFTDFKARNLLSNDIIAKMVTEYANSELDLARTHFSEKYNISAKSFYKARDFAVICCLIDSDTCERVKEKAATNCSRNNPEKSGRRSLEHFEKLYAERREFLNSFSDAEIRDIAYKYAEGIATKTIAMNYDTGAFAIKKLLKKGIALLIVDTQTTKIISNMLGSKLDNILQIRERNKQILLNCVEKEIEALKLQIECYDLYSIVTTEKPTMEELKKNLSNAIKRKGEVLRL